jgi:hypothetical protein
MEGVEVGISASRGGVTTVEFIVFVPFKTSVEYKVKVKPDTPEKMCQQAIATLMDPNFDPSDWGTDPDFYEAFGSGWRESVEDIEKADCGIMLDDIFVGLAELESNLEMINSLTFFNFIRDGHNWK